MTTAFLTDDFAYDRERDIWVPNGATFYRSYLPMTLLDGGLMGRPRFNPQQGFGINDGSEYGLFGFDTVQLKLVMEKWVVKQTQMARALGQRVIVDVDDYYDGLHEANAAHAATDPSVNTLRNRDHYARIIELADTITVTTPFLRDYYEQRHPDVRMIRNGVKIDMFSPRKISSGKPVIGWMGATSWRSGDLETLQPWLPDFLEDHDLIFHHSGWHPQSPLACEQAGVPKYRASIHKMMPLPLLHKLMCFDIGLVPLNDVPFNHAKSNLKGMEYAAAGIPFIAQALPEYLLLEESGCGVTASTPAEWREQAERLLDPKERRRDAARNLRAVKEHWDYQHRGDDWRAVYG